MRGYALSLLCYSIPRLKHFDPLLPQHELRPQCHAMTQNSNKFDATKSPRNEMDSQPSRLKENMQTDSKPSRPEMKWTRSRVARKKTYHFKRCLYGFVVTNGAPSTAVAFRLDPRLSSVGVPPPTLANISCSYALLPSLASVELS